MGGHHGRVCVFTSWILEKPELSPDAPGTQEPVLSTWMLHSDDESPRNDNYLCVCGLKKADRSQRSDIFMRQFSSLAILYGSFYKSERKGRVRSMV